MVMGPSSRLRRGELGIVDSILSLFFSNIFDYNFYNIHRLLITNTYKNNNNNPTNQIVENDNHIDNINQDINQESQKS